LYARLEPTLTELLTGLHSRGRLLAFLKNIKQGWQRLAVTNTLAYYDAELSTVVKSSIVEGPVNTILVTYFDFRPKHSNGIWNRF
jgi:hypothetical protein